MLEIDRRGVLACSEHQIAELRIKKNKSVNFALQIKLWDSDS